MTKDNFLIYGSYGYTGNLIANLACKMGLHPTLGGRNKSKLIKQSQSLNLDYRHFDLNDLEATKIALQEYACVIHCAGPFIHTYQNMVKACLAVKTHYIDITGEVEVIEHLSSYDQQAKDAHIMVLPGAGFDVVPSDCLAQHLKNRLPDASELVLAIKSTSQDSTTNIGASRGTTKTMAEGITSATYIRDKGKLKPAPTEALQRHFNFGEQRDTLCTAISWGDLASAWWSTQIPHIETYMALPDKFNTFMRMIKPFKWILKTKLIKKMIENYINTLPEGPNESQRAASSTQILGEVKNASGKQVRSLLETPNGYDLTAEAVLLIVTKVLGGQSPIGFQTPSTAYGKDLILEIENVKRVDL